MHIGQFGCSKKYRSSKRPCSPGQQCSEALQIVPPGGHLPEKVTNWSMPRILQLKLFSCLDHVVRQSSVCSEQSEMSGEGQGSAKIRRGLGQVEGRGGGAIEEGLFGQRDWQKGAGTGKLEIPPTLSYPASPSLLWATPPPLQRLRT